MMDIQQVYKVYVMGQTFKEYTPAACINRIDETLAQGLDEEFEFDTLRVEVARLRPTELLKIDNGVGVERLC